MPTWLFVLSMIALAAMAIVLFLALFDRGLRYKIAHPPQEPLESEEFLCMFEALTDAKLHRRTNLRVLTNGDQFYEAMLEAISRARHHVHIEAYIFQTDTISQRFVDALAERARGGVKVRVVLDAVGSAATTHGFMQPITDVGGCVAFYHPLRISKLPKYNNRTHRELMIVDGQIGFIGGPGVGDHWFSGDGDHPRWRDTSVELRGDAVPALQACFAENWLEASGELLTSPQLYPLCEEQNDTAVFVLQSTPSAGGSTRARIAFQLLLASAQKSIKVQTPYFLPDKSLREELLKAVERGVEVTIIVPGKKADHILTRSTSRAMFGRLLKGGVRIFEYQPSMIHVKSLMVDSTWSVVGSTNFDNRSFGLNDETNVVVHDPSFTARMEQDFALDLAESKEVTLKDWKDRPLLGRLPELVGWVLERQQ